MDKILIALCVVMPVCVTGFIVSGEVESDRLQNEQEQYHACLNHEIAAGSPSWEATQSACSYLKPGK